MSTAFDVDLSALAFGHWDEPRESEPAHGHLIRCLSLNGQTRTASAAFQLDINGRNLKPDQCLSLMLRHPMERAALLAFNTPVVGRSVRLRGHEFSSSDWSLAYRRYCAGCLGESAHHRNWWDFRFMNRCPYHGCLIEGGAGSSRLVRWSATDLAWADGELLVDPDTSRLKTMPLTIESYVLGRLGIMPSTPTAIDDYPLRIIVEAARAVGKLVVGGWTARPLSVGRRAGNLEPAEVYSAGLFALAHPDVLRNALRDIAAACPLTNPESRAEIGVSRMFGWAFTALRQRAANPLIGMATEAMIDIAAEDGRVRRHPIIVGGRAGSFGRYTMKEAAKLLGTSRRGMAILASRVLPGFAAERDTLRVHLSHDDVDLIEKARKTSLTRKSLAAFLGLQCRDITDLVENKIIEPCNALHGGKPGGRYLASEARALAERIAGFGDDLTGFSGRELSFRSCAKIRGVSGGQLAVEVLKGVVRPTRHLGASGFAGFNFPAEEGVHTSTSFDRRRAWIATRGLLFSETAVRLGVRIGAVAELVRLGYLTAIEAGQTGTGRHRIEVSSVIEFERKFVPARSLASTLGCYPANASKHLKKMGVQSIIESRFTPIFNKDEIGNLSERKSFATDRSELDLFWKYLRLGMNVRCPSFLPPSQILMPTVPLWNSSRSVLAILTIKHDSMSIVVECDPKKSARRVHRFRERRHLLDKLPSVKVERQGEGFRLFSQYAQFRTERRDTWDGAAAWVFDHLAVFQEMFLARLRKGEAP